MRRVPEVIDCWYDAARCRSPSGAIGRSSVREEQRSKTFRKITQFPADFISEAIDQTRGWFYSQLAISTLLFGGAGEQGSRQPLVRQSQPPASALPSSLPQLHRPRPHARRRRPEMSKRKRNYLPPDEIFDRYGADALRWYFFANQPPWTTIRYNEQAIKDSIPEFLLRLWNVYSFFVIYANIDGFDPARRRHAGAEWRRRASRTSRQRSSPPRNPTARRKTQRTRSLDPQRAKPHLRRRRRAHGRLRQLRRLPAHHRLRRCTLQLVRAPQPRPLLGRRQARSEQTRRLLDALRSACHDDETRCAVRPVSGRNDSGRT